MFCGCGNLSVCSKTEEKKMNWYWVVLIGFGCFYAGMMLMAIMAVGRATDEMVERLEAEEK